MMLRFSSRQTVDGWHSTLSAMCSFEHPSLRSVSIMIRFSSVRRWHFGAPRGAFCRFFVAIGASLRFCVCKKAYSQRLTFFPPPDVARSTGQPLKAKPRNIALETRTRAHLSMVSITSSVSAPPPASAIAASRRTISSSLNSGKSCLFLCERRPPFCRTNKIN